jgi:hypothetical protein
MAIILTPQQLLAQWTDAIHDYAVGLHNFTALAGQTAVEMFQRSFDIGRFNDYNTLPWRARTRSYSHPILHETGSMKKSIKWKQLHNKRTRVYTDRAEYVNSNRNKKGICYADIHNAPDGTYFNSRTGTASVQRQFMGNSQYIEDELEFLTSIIFAKLPK